MLRASDAPTTVTERINSASTRLDELARAQGRGSQRLSNDAEHVLNLNPQSPNPLLVATGGNDEIDVGLGFQAGALEVRTRDGGGWANVKAQGAYFGSGLTADHIIAGNGADFGNGAVHGVHTGSANLDTAFVRGILTADKLIAGNGADFGGGVVNCGGLNAPGVYCPGTSTFGNIICGGGADFGSAPVHGVHTGSANLDSAYVGGTVTAGKVIAGGGADFGGGNVNCFAVNANSLASRGADGGVNWDFSGALQVVNRIGTAFHGVYASNFALASDRALKEDIEHVERADAAELIRGLQPREFRWTGRPGRTVGFVAQEMPERLVARTSVKDEADVDTEMLGYDMSQLLAVAVATIQHQTQRLDDQQAQIDALTARVDRLERDTPSPIA